MEHSHGRLATTLIAAFIMVVGCTGAPADSPAPQQPTANAAGAGADGAGDPYYPTDGNGGYDVTDYNVSISYDPAVGDLDGDTTVTANATSDLNKFNLDMVGFDIGGIDVNDKPARFSREGDHELSITPSEPIGKGASFKTRVRYKGKPTVKEDGQLGANGWQKSRSGGAFVAGEPHSAAFWFPANDHPRDKATFRLTARVPDGWSVISNGREEPSSSADGWTTFRWVEETRLATYLTTIGIDKWIYERSNLPDGTPVVTAYAPGE